MMCQNYEKQLQRLQKEFLDLKDKKDALITFAKKEKVLQKQEFYCWSLGKHYFLF